MCIIGVARRQFEDLPLDVLCSMGAPTPNWHDRMTQYYQDKGQDQANPTTSDSYPSRLDPFPIRDPEET